MWVKADGINNSAGNLALHIAGNLQHFIGAALGNSGYVRNRKAEFAKNNVPKEEVIKEIDHAIEVIQMTLPRLSEDDLQKPFPIEVFESPIKTEFFLLHLLGHLNYHLGQINYHRRLIE
jgi:uncharacterized damage-inducible protein DinB